MSNLNRVDIIGHVGDVPKTFALKSGGHSAFVSVATNTKYKGKDGTVQTKVQWHSVYLYNGVASALFEKRLQVSKGALVYLCGKLQTRQWEDKEGHTRYSTVIVASRFQLLDKKPLDNEGASLPEEETLPAFDDEALPF